MTTETDNAWAAGFIDGEGHLHAVWRPEIRSLAPRLEVVQRDPLPLERLRDLYGCGIRQHSRNEDGSIRAWKWTAGGATNCSRVLAEVRPYLIVKAAEAEVLAELCERILATGHQSRGIGDEEVIARLMLGERLAEFKGPRRQTKPLAERLASVGLADCIFSNA